MNKKHGFTLIELLAVIVVLAIIALIATPIVMNTIKRSKKGAAERSADSYVKQVEVAVATERLNGNILEGEYQITSDGNLCRDKSASCSDDEKIKIEMNGTKPTSGKIKITNGSVDQSSSNMTIGDYNVSYNPTKKTYEATEKNNSTKAYTIKVNLTNVTGDSGNVTSITSKDIKSLKFTANLGYELPDSVTVSGATSVWDKTTGTLTLSKVTGEVNVTIEGVKVAQPTKTYSNGEVVYFNVTTGKKCSNYTVAQSNTGVKSGCMKFYAFNDDGGSNVNLLLDHNTVNAVPWNSSKNNITGPKEVLEQLKTDTSSWVGTITPENYSIDQSEQTSKAKYTIDYSSYKARLITAQEIAKITGNTTFDEKTSTSYFFFDTNTTTASSTCTNGNTSGCNYGWLYDRTDLSCTRYGCLNNSDVVTDGYWTISSYASGSGRAWGVNSSGGALKVNIVQLDLDYGDYYGVRPVITVAKSQLG